MDELALSLTILISLIAVLLIFRAMSFITVFVFGIACGLAIAHLKLQDLEGALDYLAKLEPLIDLNR